MEIGENIVFKQCDYVNTGKIVGKSSDGYLIQIPTQEIIFVDNNHVIGEG